MDARQPVVIGQGADQLFRLLIESVKDYAIFILDPAGQVRTWNLGAERIEGYSAQQIIGQHFSIFYPPEVVASGKCELDLEAAVRDGCFEEEGWRLRSDGTRFLADVTIQALRDRQGSLLGFAQLARDLSERKVAEHAARTLAEQRAALAERQRIHGFQERFLAILGHDLRNPLAAVELGIGVLRQRTKDGATLRLLDRMGSSSMRMSRMIEQLLDLTRIRLAGGLQIESVHMDLRATVESVVQELRAAHPARVIELDGGALWGRWDRERLQQVFFNLIGNAVLHGETNTPVDIALRESQHGAQILVHNLGAPIPLALQRVLFNPFRRGARDSRTAQTAGLGLGLYISRELILAHEGTLDFQSDLASGTTFRVTLPRTAPVRALEST